jgi:hypothetical protein
MERPAQDRAMPSPRTQDDAHSGQPEKRLPRYMQRRPNSLSRTILPAMLFLTTLLTGHGAVVTGSLTNINLQPLNTAITFTPTNDVLILNGAISAGPAQTIYSTNGQFSVTLAEGPYIVSFPLISGRRAFPIVVPPGTGTVYFTNTFYYPRYFVDGRELQVQIDALTAANDSKLNVTNPVSVNSLIVTNPGLGSSVVISNGNQTNTGVIKAAGFYGNLEGNASTATSATTATSADNATTADLATHAFTADSASTADSATHATSAGTADSANAVSQSVSNEFHNASNLSAGTLPAERLPTGVTVALTATNATHLIGVAGENYVQTSSVINVVTNPVDGTLESQAAVPVVFPNGVGGTTRWLILGQNQVNYNGTNYANFDAAYSAVTSSASAYPVIALSRGTFNFTNRVGYPGLRVIGAGPKATTLVSYSTNYDVGPANPRFGFIITNALHLQGFTAALGYSTNDGITPVFIGNTAGNGWTNVTIEDIEFSHANCNFLYVGSSDDYTNSLSIRRSKFTMGDVPALTFASSGPCTLFVDNCEFVGGNAYNCHLALVSATIRNSRFTSGTTNVLLTHTSSLNAADNIIMGCYFTNTSGTINLRHVASGIGLHGSLRVVNTIAQDAGIIWTTSKLTNWNVSFSSALTNYHWPKSLTTLTNW